jgi:uncharacterized BrkB/YihY/UPF0761 family membrane protein
MTDLLSGLGTLGAFAVALMLYVFGLLSRKLGRVTHAKPFYWGFFAAAFLVALATSVRLFCIISTIPPDQHTQWGIVYNGLFAIGVTLGLGVAWRYWSWLLAERN